MGDDPQLLLRQTRRLRVGDCVVDLALNEVHAARGTVRLTPKASAVLEVLIFIAGQPASRERLMAEVWRGETPTDEVLTHVIRELRRAFGDDTRESRYIRTLPRVGYALVAPVSALDDEEDVAPLAAPVSARERRRSRAGPVVLIVVVLVLAAGALLAWRDFRSGPAPAADPPAVQPLASMRPATSLPGVENSPTLSPDGSLIAFSANPDGEGPRIWIQVLGGDQARPLTTAPADGELMPVFSPDGRRIAFERRHGGGCRLVLVEVLGGAEHEVADCHPRTATHLAWTPDGRALLVPTALPGREDEGVVLQRLDLDNGRLAPLDYAHEDGRSDVQARYSPDGRWLAFRRGAMPQSDLWLMPAAGGQARRLTSVRSLMPGFAWTPDGQALVFASDHGGRMDLWRQPLDGGEARALGLPGAWWPDIAGSGDLVFMRDRSGTRVVEIDLDGQADAAPRWRSSSSRMNGTAVLAPDAERLALVSDRSGRAALYVEENGSSRKLAEHAEGDVAAPRWSPDGRRLLYLVRGIGTHLWVVDAASGARREHTPEGHRILGADWTADGQGMVFSSDRSGRFELWLAAALESEPRQLTEGGGRQPRVVDAGRVAYLAGGERYALSVLDLASGEARELGEQLGYWNRRAWVARPQGLFALRGSDTLGIHRLRWDAPGWELVEPLGELELAEFHLDLDPRGRRALLTEVVDAQGDIYRIDLEAL